MGAFFGCYRRCPSPSPSFFLSCCCCYCRWCKVKAIHFFALKGNLNISLFAEKKGQNKLVDIGKDVGGQKRAWPFGLSIMRIEWMNFQRGHVSVNVPVQLWEKVDANHTQRDFGTVVHVFSISSRRTTYRVHRYPSVWRVARTKIMNKHSNMHYWKCFKLPNGWIIYVLCVWNNK